VTKAIADRTLAAGGLTMLRFAIAAALSVESLSPACAQPPPGAVLLIGNKGEDSVSFVSLETGKELGRSSTGKAPHEIAISPDSKQAAVVAYGGRTVDIFDVASRKKLKTVDLSPNEGPHGIAWLKDGKLVVTTERSRSLAIVDPAAGKVLASIPTGQTGTHMVAVSSDGRRAYTANIGSGTVSVIDLARREKLRDLGVGGEPEGIALSTDDKILWVGDLSTPRVRIYDTATFARLGEVATGQVPIRVAASPDGRWIVTSNLGNGSLTIIDSRTRTKVRDLPLSGSQQAGQVTILFSPDGKRLYAAETGRDTVAEVDVAKGTVLRRLPAGKNGDGLAIAGWGTR
jgi:YVTN family beta-propeller protein